MSVFINFAVFCFCKLTEIYLGNYSELNACPYEHFVTFTDAIAS